MYEYMCPSNSEAIFASNNVCVPCLHPQVGNISFNKNLAEKKRIYYERLIFWANSVIKVACVCLPSTLLRPLMHKRNFFVPITRAGLSVHVASDGNTPMLLYNLVKKKQTRKRKANNM